MTNNQRFAAELVVLLLFGIALWAHANPKQDKTTTDVIRTQRIEIVDKDGASKIELSVKDGKPQIVVDGKDGKVQLDDTEIEMISKQKPGPDLIKNNTVFRGEYYPANIKMSVGLFGTELALKGCGHGNIDLETTGDDASVELSSPLSYVTASTKPKGASIWASSDNGKYDQNPDDPEFWTVGLTDMGIRAQSGKNPVFYYTTVNGKQKTMVK